VTCHLKVLYLLITELLFDVILYSKSNENSDAGHIKYSRGLHLSGSLPLFYGL